ncbi:MAG: valine--tRNA ligase [Holophagaceae bacterium]|nr:valine--tRNA ligase [Holophagaceae bacterium]
MSDKVFMLEMDKAFNFKTAQTRWYERWELAKVFEAKPKSGKKPWSIVIPPPNITGNLHMGHALVYTLHDILTRFKRANGFDALWVPGVDHAGIATQMVVERQLKESEGKTRHDLTREQFLEKIWSWKEQNQDNIEQQLRRMGASVDWSRKRFTMDPDLNHAVRKVFVESYRQGRIYKGPRMIQWDPASQTALSDLEVKYVEKKGKLWYIRYPLADSDGHVVVATTRPETMLGDTGVAVHSEDERYKHLLGKKLRLPLTDRLIPIVADDFVDQQFGTGCVKLTPAHDPSDHAAAKRLNLDSITVIGFDAKMTVAAGEAYAGLDRFTCRKRVVEDLEALGLIEKIEDYTHQVSVSQRSEAVLEPLVSTQWFMDVKDAARSSLEAVQSGKIKFTPQHWENVWEHWLTNIQDWCISRQLVWGHRIPAWKCDSCNELHVEMEAPPKCKKCGHESLTQDPDTLDTWFSSALWPFSVFGWPDGTEDLKRYYPTDVLITSYDILFFWVARMVMSGLTWMKDIPFKNVYFNSLVRDEHGQKMSKTKGNVIDPVQSMDDYGTDALRFSLAIMAAPGTDISISKSRLEASRNFCNKLWNAARFVQMNLTPETTLDIQPEFGEAEYWMARRFKECLTEVSRAIEQFRFHEAAETLYHLVWDDFCSTYIELAKVNLQNGTVSQKATILHFLDILLRSLHPFVPYVTEEIHEAVILERLPKGEPALLAERAWPLESPILKIEGGNSGLIPKFQESLSNILRLKSENSIDTARRVPALCNVQELEQFADAFKSLARLESISFQNGDLSSPTRSVAIVEGGLVALELANVKDPAAEKAKLEKERDKLTQELNSLRARLNNPDFLAKAAPKAIESQQQLAAEKETRLKTVLSLLGGANA